MLKKLWRLFIFIVFLSKSFASVQASLHGGIDRAPLSEKHIKVANEFAQEELLTKNKFDIAKIEAFIERLKAENEKLKKDIIETKVLEDVELYVKKPKKAKKKRSDSKKLNKNPLVIGYVKYLIPKMESLLEAVVKNKPRDVCFALVCDFIRGYASYYIPNFKRSIFPHDTDILRAVNHIFRSYRFDKNSGQIEAVNLRVESLDLPEARECLGYNISSEKYLLEKEISRLKECRFDISKLTPGISPLWKKPDYKEIQGQLDSYRKYYPSKKEKVYIKKIIYRGVGSPKLNAYFIRDDVEVEIKLKMGAEVHTELVASSLFRLIGFNQDYMRYQKSSKVYLDGMTYNELASRLANKNGIEHFNRFIWGHGKDENGEEWILIKDFLYEIRPVDELRVANLNFSSWDLQDRREYRALMLTWGWLGMNDTKFENFKFIFKKKKSGELIPLYRLQDTGVGLGTQVTISKPRDIIEMIQYYKVNSFPESFVKWNDNKNFLKIRWNDFALGRDMFKRTTWYDLKWAARVICSLDKEKIYKALIKSGMPKPVAEIYYYKLLMRRNDFVDAFDLQDEIEKDSVPNLKTYQKKDEDGKFIIKKGKVVQKVFKGKNDVVQVIDKWATFLPSLLKNFTVSQSFWSNVNGYSKVSANSGDNGKVGPGLSLEQYKKEGAFYKIPIGAGIEALISRDVAKTKQIINVAGKNHMYAITDTLKLRFGGSSPLFNELVSSLKSFSFNFNLNFLEKEYTHIHFEDSVKKAYLKKFSLFKIVGKLKEYAAKYLKPMEIIKTHVNYGIDASLDVKFSPLGFLVASSAGLGFRVKKYLTNHYTRDQYGQLHVMKEKSIREDISASLKLLEIDTFEAKLPLLSLGAGAGKFKMKFNSYFIPRGETVRDGVEEYLSKDLKREQVKILKKGVKDNDAFVNDYHLETRGSYSNFSIGALFLFNRDTARSQALTKVTQGDELKKTFYRYARFKENSFGVPNLAIDFGTTEILTKNRKKLEVVAESDLTQKEKTVFAIRIEDYYRVRTREKTEALIRDLNRRFSVSKDLPFYRGYKIPKKMQSDKFRKVYSHTRIHVSGEEFSKSLLSLNIPEIKNRLTAHFASIPKAGRFRVRMQKHHIVKLYKKIRDRKGRTIKDKSKRVKYLCKILYELRPESFGIGFLRELLKPKGLFVMGDISGIFRNFSTLQSLQQQQKRRFAGMSWGKLSKKLPLQSFMRSHRYVPVSNYIRKDLKDEEYLGRLQLSLPKNIEDSYDFNGVF